MLGGRYVVNHDDLLPSGMVLTLSVSVVVQLHFGLEAAFRAFSAVKTLQSLDFFLPLLNSHLHNSAANVAECDKSTMYYILPMLQSTRKMILLGTRVVILGGKLEISLNLTSSKILGKTIVTRKTK